MKLIGFTNFSNEDYEDIDDFDEAFDVAWELTVEHMKKYGLKWTGFYHQSGEYGVPYFDTKQKMSTGLRAWGRLMAEVLDITRDEADKFDLRHCAWAWATDEEEVYP